MTPASGVFVVPNPDYVPDRDSVPDPYSAPAHICPDCGSAEIDRVRRKSLLDYFVRIFGWRVYRCYNCRRRFYDPPSTS